MTNTDFLFPLGHPDDSPDFLESDNALADELETVIGGALSFALGLQTGYVRPSAHTDAVALVERTQLEMAGECNPWTSVDPQTMATILRDFIARGTSLTDVEAAAMVLTEAEAQRLYHFAVMVTKVRKYRAAVAPGSEGDA